MEDSEKEILINTINSSGLILEQQTAEILLKKFSDEKIQKNFTFAFQNKRIEIDCILATNSYKFLIECKRTLYSLYFLRSICDVNQAYIIEKNEFAKVKVKTLDQNDMEKFNLKSYSNCLDLIKNDEKFKIAKNDKISNAPKIAERASREELLNGYVRQILKNCEAYLCKYIYDRKRGEIGSFVPLIVTNAKLYSIEFSPEKIDSNGDLQDISNYQAEKWIAYTFSESVKWGFHFGSSKEVADLEELLEDTIQTEAVTDSGSYEKTVFIVNINYLSEFILNFIN